jgi:hypothetical protein
MKKIRLIDSCFPQTTASIAGDNDWRGPQHFEWCREGCDSLATWYTNWMVHEALNDDRIESVAWLLEPPSLKDWPYRCVADYPNYFKAILTYDKRLLDSNDNRFKFAPHGGSWIDWDLWWMYEKTKDVCMIVSDKNESEGHKLRHKIAKEFGDRIDVYGPSYQKFDRKFNVLKDYRYCVVVESVKMDYYFSEKLIDAISVGCIPIYWGCPSIGDYFDIGGFGLINELKLLAMTLDFCGMLSYSDIEPKLIANLETAKQYRMPEDWMYEHYEELFK